jgi:hypothetical protein
MKNKLFMMAMLAIALVFGMMVVGCEDSVQTVAFERADSVSEVYAVVEDYYDDEDNLFRDARISVYWSGANNAISYNLYVQQDQFFTRQLASGCSSGWNMRIPYSSSSDNLNLRFGVTANDFDENHVASKIVWSEYIAVPRDLSEALLK